MLSSQLGNRAVREYEFDKRSMTVFWVGTVGSALLGIGLSAILLLRGAPGSAAFTLAMYGLYFWVITRPSLRSVRRVELSNEELRITPVFGTARTIRWESIASARVFKETRLRSGLEQLELRMDRGGRLRVQGNLPGFQDVVQRIKAHVPSTEDTRFAT